MDKDELKKRLISECEESGLSYGEIKEAMDAARMYFFLQEEDVLKRISVKKHLQEDNILKGVPVKEHIKQKAEKAERLSNLALGLSAFSLLLVIFIEIVVK